MIDYKKYLIDDGVYLLTPVNNQFEEVYLKVREKEKRIYSDEEVEKLPFASENNPHKEEWNIRAKSFLRIKKYLETKKGILNILDLGCGNCWLSNQLSRTSYNNFWCVDLNLTGLKQGSRIAQRENMKFLYADIFSAEIPASSFDLIIINSAVQYFPSFQQLIERLFSLINDKGEIHIIDSPFYNETELKKAMLRTKDYYISLGFPEMALNYFHRSWNELSTFSYKILYNPSTFKSKVSNIFLEKDSPFPWICITKEMKTS